MSTADEVARAYGLVPLPAEGGRFDRIWAGPEDAAGRPAGSVILALLGPGPGDFSALHRLPRDEVWHFYRGDPLELLLLHPDGTDELVLLGGDGPAPRVQHVVPGGSWMGARVAPGGGWSLFGASMAPGFLPSDYRGGTAPELAAAYPQRAELIRQLCRPDGPLTMATDDHWKGRRD
ncbi:cupin domain-containing protein [Kitasatospora sp. NPDC004289]